MELFSDDLLSTVIYHVPRRAALRQVNKYFEKLAPFSFVEFNEHILECTYFSFEDLNHVLRKMHLVLWIEDEFKALLNITNAKQFHYRYYTKPHRRCYRALDHVLLYNDLCISLGSDDEVLHWLSRNRSKNTVRRLTI